MVDPAQRLRVNSVGVLDDEDHRTLRQLGEHTLGRRLTPRSKAQRVRYVAQEAPHQLTRIALVGSTRGQDCCVGKRLFNGPDRHLNRARRTKHDHDLSATLDILNGGDDWRCRPVLEGHGTGLGTREIRAPFDVTCCTKSHLSHDIPIVQQLLPFW
jgi:hypothetical protein